MADRKIDDDDISLFRESVGSVRRIRHDRVEPAPVKPPPVARMRERDEAQVLEELASGSIDFTELESGEELLFQQPGLNLRDWRKLRRGQYSIADHLDLHGLTADQAHAAVQEFLRSVLARGRRCVRIVHGKGNSSPNGRPVIKARIGRWLRQRSEVLAFCSARPVDGGTGALYVLLKRPSAGS